MYVLVKDFDWCEIEGVVFLVKELDEVVVLISYVDYFVKWLEWVLLGKGSLVFFDIDLDMKKVIEYGFFFGVFSLILLEKGYY